jgi:hypothetical protein
MMNEELLIDDDNKDAYDYLTIAIETKANRLNLLIAVCDDARSRITAANPLLSGDIGKG